MTKTATSVQTMIKAPALTFSIARLTGGLYFSVQQLNRALISEQVVSDVVTLEGGWGERLSAEELNDWKPSTLHIFPCQWPRKLGYSPRILPALNEIAPNLIHCHGLWHYHLLATNKYCRQNRIPWLLSSHGMLDGWALRNKGWKKRLAGWLYHDIAMRNAFCIRALCGAEAEAIRQSGLRNPICVIPNGVELPDERTVLKPHSRTEVWADGRKILLFLGRIAPKKGLVNLIQAWQGATARNPKLANDWVLLIAGMDEEGHEAGLQRLVAELELGQEVFFLGPQYGSAKTSLLYSANAFVLPSHSEGLPMGVLEAWAHRLPVLLTPQCNLSEGVSAGAAVQIQPTVEDIQRGLLQMFEMGAAQLSGMGEKGRRLVGEHFTWSRVASQMREVYDWMLGGQAPRRGIRLG